MESNEKVFTCERNMIIQTQAWSRLNQEPSAEPAGHSKKVWIGKAGVLITNNGDDKRMKIRKIKNRAAVSQR